MKLNIAKKLGVVTLVLMLVVSISILCGCSTTQLYTGHHDRVNVAEHAENHRLYVTIYNPTDKDEIVTLQCWLEAETWRGTVEAHGSETIMLLNKASDDEHKNCDVLVEL